MALLEIQNLVKVLSKDFKLTIPNLSIEEGEIVYIIGSNGAGKTTLSRILCGISSYDDGQVLLNNKSIKKIRSIGDYVGYLQQSKGLPEEITVSEYLNHQALLKGASDKMLKEAMQLADLTKYENTYISHLSQGTQRKIHILSSILSKPKLLIMDEPTVGIDPTIRAELNNYISSLCASGMSAIISTHYLDDAEQISDKIAIMDSGKIIYFSTMENIIQERTNNNCIEFSCMSKAENHELYQHLISSELPYINSIHMTKTNILAELTDSNNEYFVNLFNIINSKFSIRKIQRFEEPFETFLNRKLQDNC